MHKASSLYTSFLRGNIRRKAVILVNLNDQYIENYIKRGGQVEKNITNILNFVERNRRKYGKDKRTEFFHFKFISRDDEPIELTTSKIKIPFNKDCHIEPDGHINIYGIFNVRIFIEKRILWAESNNYFPLGCEDCYVIGFNGKRKETDRVAKIASEVLEPSGVRVHQINLNNPKIKIIDNDKEEA